MTTPQSSIENAAGSGCSNVFAVGRMVSVASRTWPGINEPGGVGRVVAVHYESKEGTPTARVISHVDVHYMVLQRREKRVPIQYVTLAPEYESFEASNDRLRDRNMLKGRCSRCGSLRVDCRSCDWLAEMGQHNSEREESTSNIQDDQESSSEDDNLQKKLQNTYQEFRSLSKRCRRRTQPTFEESNGDGKDSGNEISQDRLITEESEDENDFIESLSVSNRKYFRLKARWRRFGKLRDSGVANRNNTQESPASATSDDNIALADLARQPRAMMYAARAQARSKRRRSHAGTPSVLETLGLQGTSETANSNHSSEENSRSSQSMISKEKNGKSRIKDDDSELSIDANGVTQNHLVESPVADNFPGSLVGKYEDDFSKDDLPSPFANDSQSPPTHPVLSSAHLGTSQELLALSDFIQPEGEEAVQNLPSDIKDLSHYVSFTSLPTFIDEFLAKVEDEMIPDAKLELAYFEIELLEADNSPKAKEVKCLEMFNALRDRLVRDGVDQCRRALGKLDNAELYRLKCKNLSHEERNQFRGVAMEMRDLRLERLDEEIESLMKRAMDLLRAHQSHQENESQSEDEDGFYGALATPDKYESQDIFNSDSLNREHHLAPSPSNAFDPHRYATRVRKRQAECMPSKKSNGCVAGRKRKRHIGGESAKNNRMHIGPARHPQSTDQADHARNNASKGRGTEKISPNLEELQKLHFTTRRTTCELNKPRAKPVNTSKSVNRRETPFVDQSNSKHCHLKDDTTHGRVVHSASLPKTTSPSRTNCRRTSGETTRLRNVVNASLDEEQANPMEVAAKSVSDLCRILLDIFPENVVLGKNTILEIRRRIEILSATEISSIFHTILQILQLYGKSTLQELVAIQSSSLDLHIELLSLTLTLLSKGFFTNLDTNDGVVFQVFGEDKGQRFVALVLLQLVDGMYAAVHPVAWGRQIERAKQDILLKSFEPLRNAIAQIVPIVESVAHCVVHKLCSQRWRSRGESHAWVSSVDPNSWEMFLASGITVEIQEPIRLSSFGGKLPRCEIDALWKILAYCADARVKANNKSCVRWELLSAILSQGAGVLAGEGHPSERQGIPSKQQLDSCAIELNKLSELIKTGCLDDLPSSDTFLFKTIEKSVSLQASVSVADASCLFDDELADVTTFEGEVQFFWNSTNLCNEKRIKVDSASSSTLLQYFVPSTKSLGSLLPSKDTTTNCLRLLGTWMSRVPAKRARWLRLVRGIEGLVEKLLGHPRKSITNDSHGTIPPTSCSVLESENLVNKEAAVYILILSASFSALMGDSVVGTTNQPFSEHLRATVWRVVADDKLQQKQAWIIGGAIQPAVEEYCGPVEKIGVAVRTVALLTFLHLGVPFWNCSSETNVTQLSVDLRTSVAADNNAMLFLFSCLLATMDCLCDLLSRQTIFSFTEDSCAPTTHDIVVEMTRNCWQLGMLLVHVTNIAASNSPTETPNCHHESQLATLASTFFPIASPILSRSLQSLVSIAIGGKEVDFCFRSCLGVLRSAMGAMVATKESTFVSTPPLGLAVGDEDLFAGIEDDAMASLEIEGNGEIEPNASENVGRVDAIRDALHSISGVLKKLIEECKPSSRFDVNHCYQQGERLATSVRGRLLLARQLGGICSCVAAIAAVGNLDEFFPGIFTVQTTESSKNYDDNEWEFHFAQCLSSELAKIGRYFERPKKIIEQNSMVHLSNLIRALLDADTMERFPTCNLTRIRETGGVQCYRSEKRCLLYFNASDSETSDLGDAPLCKMENRKDEELDTPGAAYNGRFLWAFCRNLGELCCVLESEKAMLVFDGDTNGDIPALFIGFSLESECMKRARLLRTAVSASVAQESISGLSFRNIARVILAASFSQFIRVSNGLSYFDRAVQHEGDDPDNWKRPKLLELLSCYAELSTTMLCWILRANSSAAQKLTNEELSVYLNFLSQALSKDDFDVCEGLRRVVCCASGHLFRASVSLRSSESLRGCLRRAILRRGKQLVVYLAAQHQMGSMSLSSDLFRAILTSAVAGSDDIAGFDAKQLLALVCSWFNAVETKSLTLTEYSPIEGAIDRYMDFVDSMSLTGSETICKVKFDKVIRDFLLPRIERTNLDTVKRKPAIILLSHLLQSRDVSSCCLEESLMCSIVNCLWSCLRLSVIDDDILSSVFYGTTGLIAMPAHAVHGLCLESNRSHNLMQAIHIVSKTTIDEAFDCLGSHERHARYVCHFVECLKELGHIILDSKDEDRARLEQIRVCMTNEAEFLHGMNSSNLNPVVESFKVMARYRTVLFAEKENDRHVRNVYVKNVQRSTGSVLESQVEGCTIWKPSTITRRKVKEFLAEVINLK